jgi:hypothetical protein
MPMHNLNNIERKIKMNASVTPAEMLLVIRAMMTQIDTLEEKLDGLETATKAGRRSSKIPEE